MLDLETTIEFDSTATTTAARQSESNCQQNLIASRQTQPKLTALSNLENLKWLFARDNTLTALQNGKWWGGCSVPAKAAQELLKTLQINSSMACFLAPAHPAQIAFALSRLRNEQAIIALLPRADDLLLTLHCHDFSADLAAHRLWFVAGEQWAVQLAELFRSNPGLAIPQQFIRTALLSDDTSAPLISSAQQIFMDELNRRSAALSQLRETRPRQTSISRKRITLAAPLHFRLWDDCGGILQQFTASDSTFDWTIINFDDPIQRLVERIEALLA